MNPLLVEGVLVDVVGLLLAAAVVVPLVLMPLSRAPLAGARALALLALQVTLLGGGVVVLRALLVRGGFGQLDVGAWQGAALQASDPTGLIPLTIDPLAAVLWVAIAVAGLGASLVSLRHIRASATTSPLALISLASACAVILASAETFAARAAAFAAASLLGAALLTSLRPSRAVISGVSRLALVHRAGDAALCLAVFLVAPALGGVEASALAASAPAIEPWSRFDVGVFSGWAPREVWQLAGFLVAAAAASRLLVAPLFLLARDAVSEAGGIAGFVHGVTSLGCGGILLLRSGALLSLAPEALQVLGVLSVVTLVVTAVLAVAARDLRRIDLLLLTGFQALATLPLVALDAGAGLLGQLVLLLTCVPLCATGAHVAGACRTADPRALGGLERLLPRTHTARLLATGALLGPMFSGAALAVHAVAASWLSPWLSGGVAVAACVGLVLLSLAAFRALHLTFTGAGSRSTLPPLRDPPVLAAIPPIATALSALGLGMLHIPRGVLAWLPFETAYAAPFAGIVAQTSALDAPVRALVLPTLEPPPVGPGALAAVAVAALVIGWLASTSLFRGGARAPLAALARQARVARALETLDAVAGSDSATRDVGEGAVRLSRLVAVNLAPAVLETALRRLPAFVSFLLSGAIRAFSSGSAQRGALFVLAGAAFTLWWWERP